MTNCCHEKCGIHIPFPEGYQDHLIKTKEQFFCVKGHSQAFTGKSEIEKLKEEHLIIDRAKNKIINDLQEKINKLSIKTLNYECPICNKPLCNLGNLHRHKKQVHGL